MLPVISTLASGALALSTAMTTPLDVPQPVPAQVAATIEFRLAESAPGPGLKPIEKDGQTFYLQPKVIISTADIASAEQGFDPLWGQPTVSLVLNSAGRDRLAAFTETHVGKILAITVDGELLTAPVIQSTIPNGRLQITGVQSLTEAMDLARKLGNPPTPLSRSLADSLMAHLERL
ncbi:SecDF P1 head subdomain-containing protein [Inquilinus sp.]|uniref:SecDF P1 head subdomain-containing protein n=1 Tax=Inquilinus sp. TaxID=1932117 RepID=UPI0037838EE5